MFGVADHRTEFVAVKESAAVTDAPLTKKDRTGRFELDQQYDEGKERCEQRQAETG
jgi:hypothetical protein